MLRYIDAVDLVGTDFDVMYSSADPHRLFCRRGGGDFFFGGDILFRRGGGFFGCGGFRFRSGADIVNAQFDEEHAHEGEREKQHGIQKSRKECG